MTKYLKFITYNQSGDIMKKFKTKKKFLKLSNIIKISILIFTFLILKTISENLKLTTSNEEFLKELLEDSNHHLIYEKQNNKLTNKLLQFLTGFNMDEPETLLVYENTIYERDSLDLENPPKLETNMYYVNNPKKEEIVNEPKVYIYNSHQHEEYNSESYSSYNIKPGVMMASYILKENLSKLGINSIVEEGNIVEFLNINNWNYNYSYDASRYFLEEALKNNPSIEFIIDLHRDSVVKSASTTTIDNKNYARLFFVVGLEHQNYQSNLDLANKLNKMVENKYPGLSRGVLTKEGSYVNGIYNQDISPNSILIEVGAYENTIDEVVNTLEVFSKILKEHLDEK